MDDEKRQSADDGDSTEVTHEYTVGSNQLVIAAMANASDDTDSDGIEYSHQS